jgi:IS30 family transposase
MHSPETHNYASIRCKLENNMNISNAKILQHLNTFPRKMLNYETNHNRHSLLFSGMLAPVKQQTLT